MDTRLCSRSNTPYIPTFIDHTIPEPTHFIPDPQPTHFIPDPQHEHDPYFQPPPKNPLSYIRKALRSKSGHKITNS